MENPNTRCDGDFSCRLALIHGLSVSLQGTEFLTSDPGDAAVGTCFHSVILKPQIPADISSGCERGLHLWTENKENISIQSDFKARMIRGHI